MAELVQLGLDLSLLAIDGRHAKECSFARAAVEARVRVCAFDALIFWKLQRSEGAHSETLVCSAADGAGTDGLIGRTQSTGNVGDTGKGAPTACAAIMRSSKVDAPLVVVEVSNRTTSAELQSRYGRAVSTAVYVPVNAPSVWEAGTIVHYGVLEAIMHVRPEKVRAVEAATTPGAPAAAEAAAAAASTALSDVTLQQLRQLGSHLAASLQTFALLHSEEQGERLLYRMMPKHIVAQLQQRRTVRAAAAAAAAAATSPRSPTPKPASTFAPASAFAAFASVSTSSSSLPISPSTASDENFIVDSCERAFVLFCDLEGFTSYCARRQPSEVVTTLNSLFATFDALLPQHRVHKVTTIGDCYVAAAGLSFMSSSTPQRDILAFALDLIAAVHGFHTADGEVLRVRIGIHVGPIAAGVVGVAMPRYALFGETVTVAEHLEERALPNRILISRAVHRALLEPLDIAKLHAHHSVGDGHEGGGGASSGGGGSGGAGGGVFRADFDGVISAMSGAMTGAMSGGVFRADFDGGDATRAPCRAHSAADDLGITFEPLEALPEGLEDPATSSASSDASTTSTTSAVCAVEVDEVDAAAAPLLVIVASERQRSARRMLLGDLTTAHLSYFRGRIQPTGHRTRGSQEPMRRKGATSSESSWELPRRISSSVSARGSSSLSSSLEASRTGAMPVRDVCNCLSLSRCERESRGCSSRELPSAAPHDGSHDPEYKGDAAGMSVLPGVAASDRFKDRGPSTSTTDTGRSSGTSGSGGSGWVLAPKALD
jgi:class 3 adenylate cyclase